MFIVQKKSKIKIHDSLFSNFTGPHRHKFLGQLGWMLHTSSDAITLEWLDVQQQRGSEACGLYAIANAYALCAKMKPEDCAWDQNGLYTWLVGCLKAGNMSPPPITAPHRRTKGTVLEQVEPVHCVCRLPNDPQLPVIACDTCFEWYHLSCLGVASPVARDTPFHCSRCR